MYSPDQPRNQGKFGSDGQHPHDAANEAQQAAHMTHAANKLSRSATSTGMRSFHMGAANAHFLAASKHEALGHVGTAAAHGLRANEHLRLAEGAHEMHYFAGPHNGPLGTPEPAAPEGGYHLASGRPHVEPRNG